MIIPNLDRIVKAKDQKTFLEELPNWPGLEKAYYAHEKSCEAPTTAERTQCFMDEAKQLFEVAGKEFVLEYFNELTNQGIEKKQEIYFNLLRKYSLRSGSRFPGRPHRQEADKDERNPPLGADVNDGSDPVTHQGPARRVLH